MIGVCLHLELLGESRKNSDLRATSFVGDITELWQALLLVRFHGGSRRVSILLILM